MLTAMPENGSDSLNNTSKQIHSVADVNRVLASMLDGADTQFYKTLAKDGKDLYDQKLAHDSKTHKEMVSEYATLDSVIKPNNSRAGATGAQDTNAINIPFAYHALRAYTEIPDVVAISATQWSYLMFGMAAYVNKSLGEERELESNNLKWYNFTQINLVSCIEDDNSNTHTVVFSTSDQVKNCVQQSALSHLPENITKIQLHKGVINSLLKEKGGEDTLKQFVKSIPIHAQDIEFNGSDTLDEEVRKRLIGYFKESYNPSKWNQFFQGYEKINKNKLWVKLTSGVLSFLYASIEGLVGAIGVVCVVFAAGHLAGASAPVILISAITLGLLSTITNVGVGYSYIQTVLASLKSAWESIKYNTNTHGKKHKWIMYASILFCIAPAAVLVGVLHGDALGPTHIKDFLQHMYPHMHGLSHVAAANIVYAAIAIAVFVTTIEMIMFVSSCVDFYRNHGNPLVVVKSATEQAFGLVKGSKFKRALVGCFMFLMIACSLAGIFFIATGSSKTVNNGLFKNYIATWFVLVPAMIGMAFFFVKNAMGFVHITTDKVIRAKGKFKKIMGDHLKKNAVFWLGVVASVVCAAAAAPPGVGLMIILLSALVNVGWKMIVKALHNRKICFKHVDFTGTDVVDFCKFSNSYGLASGVASCAPEVMDNIKEPVALPTMFSASTANCVTTNLESQNALKAKAEFDGYCDKDTEGMDAAVSINI